MASWLLGVWLFVFLPGTETSRSAGQKCCCCAVKIFKPANVGSCPWLRLRLMLVPHMLLLLLITLMMLQTLMTMLLIMMMLAPALMVPIVRPQVAA